LKGRQIERVDKEKREGGRLVREIYNKQTYGQTENYTLGHPTTQLFIKSASCINVIIITDTQRHTGVRLENSLYTQADQPILNYRERHRN
jgi:hypothetical protein